MKINSVEQFIAEIKFNIEFQEKLRENPVKAVEEIEVGSSPSRGVGLFTMGVVGGAVVLFAIIGSFIIAASRASTSDIENLQAQIDSLKPLVSEARADAASAKASAAEAAAKAAAAEAAANRAAQYAQDTNLKLDRLFNKSKVQ